MVLPTVHPAAVLRQPSLMRRVKIDWARIAQRAIGVHVEPPERTLLVAGIDVAWEVVWSMAHEAHRNPCALSVDIETLPDKGVITCIGFAWSATYAVTISLYYPDYASGMVVGDMVEAETLCKYLLCSPGPKVVQNGVGYDRAWVRKKLDTDLCGRIYDTRWMHHSMYPSDGGDDYVGRSGFVGEDHGLAYLASVYTAEPYWKDEAKDSDRRTQLRYNGKDCAVTYEIWEALCKELVERGRWEYYVEAYESLYDVLGDPEHLGGGVRMDLVRRKTKLAQLTTETVELMARLDGLGGGDPVRLATLETLFAGEYKGKRGKEFTLLRAELKDLRAKSIFGSGGGISYPKVIEFLQVTCGITLPKKRGKDGKATDEVTLRQVYLRTKANPIAQEAIPLILGYRNVTKQGTFLAEKNFDSDGYVRCTYTLLPETGRLSSQSNAFGTGTNLQNIMREVRDVFTADPGHVLLEVDLSTAEDRVVKMLTRDPAMRKLAQTPPWELDQHRYNAACMFNKAESEITRDDRELAKRTCHGTSYGMSPARMSEVWLKESEGKLVRTAKECEGLQQLYVNRVMPQLLAWQAEIRMEIMQYRCLSNPFGRVLDLTWERLDDETFKRGYAFKPQSIVGMLVNKFGLRPVWERLRGDLVYTGARVAIQLHDALYLSTPPEHVYDLALMCQQALEKPVLYYGHPMTIPVCFKVGLRWGKGVEWKRLPSRAEMLAVAMEAVKA